MELVDFTTSRVSNEFLHLFLLFLGLHGWALLNPYLSQLNFKKWHENARENTETKQLILYIEMT